MPIPLSQRVSGLLQNPTRLSQASIDAAIAIVWPPICTFCTRPLPDDGDQPVSVRLCPECCLAFTRDSRDACHFCGAAIGPFLDPTQRCAGCLTETFRFSQTIRLGLYEDDLREACIRGKSPNSEALPTALAALLWQREAGRITDFAPDIVAPVPQHWLHWFSRPHHQAATIGHTLAAALRIPCRERAVSKIRRTEDQSNLNGEKRRNNLRNAFAVKRREAPHIAGARVLVTDDIFTTGSTANAVASALRKAGASDVALAVLAVVPP